MTTPTLRARRGATPHEYRGVAIQSYPALCMLAGSVKTRYRLRCQIQGRVFRADSWPELKALVDAQLGN
jgi:hypothetical protein